jgi:hypothetical protein
MRLKRGLHAERLDINFRKGLPFLRTGRNSAEVTTLEDAKSSNCPLPAAASCIRATILSTEYSGLVIFAGSFTMALYCEYFVASVANDG